jgi:O-antigen ligase
MKKIKILYPYIILFILTYFGAVKIGPITFSQIWKIPLFAFLFWQVLIKRNDEKLGMIKWSYARATKNLVTANFSVSYFYGVVDFIRYMMFPLMFEYAYRNIKSIQKLDKMLLGFAQFIIISGIPFSLGLLESKAGDAQSFIDFDSYIGMFQNTHGASITTTTAVLILMAYLKVSSSIIKFKKLNYLLLSYGIFLIYLTFVRTGYLMFIVGVVFLFIPKKLSFKQIVSGLAVLLILGVGFYILLESNQTFYNRIFDIRNGKQTAAGSGRFLFWMASLELWYNGSIFEMFFGHGFYALIMHIYQKTGLAVFAHNEFFTQLGQNGLLGVIFFIGYLISLFKFIWKRKILPSYRLAMAIFFLYGSLMMTQGGMWFELDIFMVLVFVKLEFEKILRKRMLRYD